MTSGVDLEELRSRLVQRRGELRQRADRIASDLRRDVEPASPDAPDRAIQTGNDEVLVSLSDAAHAELARIDDALERLSQPGGLLCRACGRPIDPERLAVLADADTCGHCVAGQTSLQM
jgi:RNA polymerase-binding transcription factor DksA